MKTVTTLTPRTLDLDTLVLSAGAHSSISEGSCLLEAASYLAGEPWSDHPACVCPVIAAFGRAWNDNLDDAGRQRLKRFLPLLLHTRSMPEIESRRAWLCTDWLVRVHTSAWLRLAGLEEQAAALEELDAFTDDQAANRQQPTLSAAYSAAYSAARSAADSVAYSAARSAALSAARSAAYSAARSAADSVAYSAARSAAYSAARSVAYSVADSVAYSAADSVAYSAAYSAADSAADSVAYSAAYSAALSAARSALEPTKLFLQASAEALLERMIALTPGAA